MENLLTKATHFARAAHRNQRRKYTNEPYINHPLEVVRILREQVPDVTEIMLVAAVLHDVVEDTPTQLWEIGATFGAAVEKLVGELTEPKFPGNRAARKEAEAKRLATVSSDAQTIKCADILANLRDIDEHDPKFAPVYKHEKRRALIYMSDAYGPLRDTAWLATFPLEKTHERQ